jgi:hypothetical protein
LARNVALIQRISRCAAEVTAALHWMWLLDAACAHANAHGQQLGKIALRNRN